MKHFFLILLLLCAFNGAAQSLEMRFDGTVTNIDAAKKESGVNVSLIQGGSTVISTTTASNGKYTLKGQVNYNQPFEIVFSKGGFVSKKVGFSLAGLNEEDTPAGDFRPVQSLDMEIFGSRPNVDFSFLDSQPVAQFFWDKSAFTVDFNKSQAAQMRTKIDKLLLDAENKAAENEAKYNQAIAAADKAYNAKDYPAALSKYEEALSYKPKEKYPSDRILELDEIIQKQKEEQLADQQQNAEYYNLIQAADNFRNAKEYEKAKTKYNEALAKKDEQYPRDEIKKIDAILKEKENQAAYDAAIELGDMMLNQKSYKAARDKYTEASKLKPSEQYPKDKLAQLDAKIKAQEDIENNKKKYEAAVAEGDRLFTEESWEASKAKYQEALTFESAATYPAGRIDMIDAKLAELKAEKEKQEQIAKLLQEGAAAETARNYEEALTKYKAVIALDAANAVATPKIPALEKLIADAAKNAEMEAQFKALVDKGDAAVTAKKLEEAVTNYEQALQLKQDVAVQTKLADVKKQLEDLENAAQLKADYDKLMADGKALLDAKDYAQALTKYEAAKALMPAEQAPQVKIDEINALIAKQNAEKEKTEQIAALLQQGETLMTSEQWEPAKAKFNEVLALEATNATAKEQIKAIDAKLLELKSQAENEAKFNEWVSKGDAETAAQKWESAIVNYKEALKIKQDASVQEKVDAAQQQLNALAADKEKEEQYQAAIKTADKQLAEKKYELAKASYESALALKPAESYPAEKIASIDQLMADLASAAEKENQIKQLLNEGQTLLEAKDYAPAKGKYEQVLTLAPDNATALAKLTEISSAMAAMMDQQAKDEQFNALKQEGLNLAAQEQWNPAKLKLQEALQIKEDAEVKAKIGEIDAILLAAKEKETRIQTLLTEGEKLFNDEKFENARPKYEEVLSLDAGNSTATEKLQQIDKELAGRMGQQQQEAEFKRLKEVGYAAAVAKDWPKAKSSLQQALDIKDDAEVRTKLSDIEAAMLAEAEANELNEKYNAAMAAAQEFEAKQNYADAINRYKEAGALKPNEQLPKTKVTELTKLLNNQSASEELNEQYNALLKKGDELVSAQDYIGAITAYNEALALKPTEQLPVEKAKQAQALADAQNKSEEDAQYEKILATISTKITEGDYTKAREYIDRALKLRPEDSRPKALLSEIELLERQNAQYAALMKEGETEANGKNYEKAIGLYEQAKTVKPSNPEPQARIDALRQLMDAGNEAAEKAALFKQYFDAGVKNQSAGDYETALSDFNNALNVRPDDAPTKAKIAEVQQVLDRLANERESKLAQQQEFNALVKEADGFFDTKNYQKSVEAYRRAQAIQPGNRYVKQRINEAEKLSREETLASVQREYQKILKAADNNFNTGNYSKATEYYKRALSFRPSDSYPKKKLAEIDAILNPVSETGPVLEPLGEIYDNSIMDGQTALAQAQAQRESMRAQRVKNRLDAIGDSEAERTAQKTDDHRANSNEIYRIYRSVSQDSENRDLNRQELVEALREAEKEQAIKENEDQTYERVSNLQSRSYIEAVQQENAIDYGERESVYTENHGKVVDIQTDAQDAYSYKSDNFYAENIETNQALDEVASEYSTDYIDNTNKRINEALRVDVVRTEAQNILSDKGHVAYDAKLTSKSTVDGVYISVEEENAEKSTWAAENSEEVKIIANQIADQESKSAIASQDHARATDDQIRKVQLKISDDNTNRDLNRLETVEVMKSEADRFAEEARNQNQKESGKYLDNKASIDEQNVLNAEVADKAELRKAENTATVERLQKQANLQVSEQGYSDEQERLAAQQGMDNVKAQSAQRAAEEAEKVVKNGAKLDDVSKSMAVGNASTANEKKQAIYKSKQAIDNVESKQMERAVISNKLGEEYPEGVSQEVFQRKDENGILSAIITRRIVVQQGHGDVYVKTQTLNATTYAKNGNPITEYVWQKETQAAHLERHY